jgi:hypothetical protein
MALTKVSTGVVDMSGNTGGLVIAKGNGTDVSSGGEQPTCVAAILGSIRENTDSGVNKVEVCTSTGWQFLEEAGSTIVPLTVDYLIVAGGGGGGNGQFASGAGGGAGEYLTNVGGTTLSLTPGTPYSILVGARGAKGSPGGGNGSSGSNSQFISSTYLARGGGGGNNVNSTATNSGGSGGGAGAGYPSGKTGGASTAVAPGIGSAGGNSDYHGTYYASGGGGGAGSAGQTGNDSNGGGNGGAGLQNSITVASGSGTYYAAGGGGGLFGPGSPLGSYSFNNNVGVGGSSIGGSGNASGVAFAGTVNTGSGGGGASYGAGSPYTEYMAGDGSSGVVILRFPTSFAAPTPTLSNNIATSEVANVGGYRIMTYTCTDVTLDGTVTLTF